MEIERREHEAHATAHRAGQKQMIACAANAAEATVPERVQLGSVPVDRLTFEGALGAIDALIASGAGGAVFTPNVDHVVTAEQVPLFREAYARAALSLADGQPVVWAARLLGEPVPAKISGSDLFLPLMKRAAAKGWRVFLLGGAPGVAEEAAVKLREELGVQVVGTAAPMLPTLPQAETLAAVRATLEAARPQLVVVGLGAPKQELLIDALRAALPSSVLIGLGASLDFYTGRVARAPRWMSAHGLEWLYRLSREPRRLWRRYLVRDPAFLLIVLRQLLGRLSPRRHGSSRS